MIVFILQFYYFLYVIIVLFSVDFQLRSEGKDYVVQEGDVMLFRFNV